MILDKKNLLFSIIFCIFIFLISFFTLNKFINNAMNKNSEKQLLKANKQSAELGKVKLETVLDNKMDIFLQNVLSSGAIEGDKINNEKIIPLIKNFRKENFIEIMGVVLGNEEVFISKNDEIITVDQNGIHDIISQGKFAEHSIEGENYLAIKTSLDDGNGHNITAIYLEKDNSKNTDLIVPVYTELGCSYVIESNGNGIFYSTEESTSVRLDNILDIILSYSEDNIDIVDKMKIDMINKKSGIIKYKGPGEIRWMAYSPIGYEGLYLCTIIPEAIIGADVDEIGNLNSIATIVIIIDIVLIFGFFKFIEIVQRKKDDKILNLDSVTNGNSYKKFNEELKKIYNKKETKAIYMSIDLDNFKIVNTVLGKEYGDEVLKKIYEILKFHIGDNGCYCRKEADEFLAYYKYKDYEDVEHIVNIICESIRHIKLPQNHILIPSVGIYYMNGKDVSIEILELNANIARKKSKNKINEFYSYFEENNFNELIDNKSILDDMNKAIKNKEFRLVYQPKFDAKTQNVVGAEALIRWTKPDKTTVFPNEFIPVAEKTGFITFIDSYVFREVCEKQAEWLKKGYNIIPISLNISREKLKDQNFLYEYLKIIGEVDLEKEYVQLEITEGHTLSYDNVRSNIVDKIKEAGFKVLIDDFGVGYSSLTMLKDIDADVLKLDRSFVTDDSNSGKSMLKHIIKIAKIFNYKIVAEGVETEEQYNFLKEECDEIQGYYFSKPLEEDEFIDKYLNNL
ncbi:EAL domain-containing protein [Clostridium cuniculi]|uniref:bifunctional diguanylate cyclase/phosphodiesterase n=1 Tax=Clostridium cuniculi TaxID=2548455 RepID=UPI0010563EC6|nr:EAL domain-containing protein [Clostridium cuniculi]